jgi:SAM-dependent methyltransferase
MLAFAKKRLPWWAKLGGKVILARTPLTYALWQKLGLFRHGHMDIGNYALDVFNVHVFRAGLSNSLHGKTVLEIGPGDSIATALIAYAYGARTILLDSGAFARKDLEPYFELCDILRARGLSPPDIEGATEFAELLEATGGQYLTAGLLSWRQIPSRSVDFVFSQAVMEHVRKHEFFDMLRECFRVMSDGGVASHQVDLRDHLGGALNNLRFSERIWESEFFVRSGFYTNRIQYNQMLKLFSKAGFAVEVLNVRRWETLPTPLEKFDIQFFGTPNDELRVWRFDVVLRPNI